MVKIRHILRFLGHSLMLLTMALFYFATLVASYFRINIDKLNIFSSKIIVLMLSAGWRLSSFFGVLFLVVLGCTLYVYLESSLKRIHKAFFVLLGLVFFGTSFFSARLIAIESHNYNNYLYSVYGITRSGFELLLEISIVVLILFIAFVFNELGIFGKIKKRHISNRQLITFPFLTIIIWFSLMTLVRSGDILSYSRFTYETEFRNYGSMIALSKQVPTEGKIIIPEQGMDWPDISNAPIARYFLFPRVIVSSTYIVDERTAIDLKDAYFVLLDNNDGTVWPVLDKKNQRIYFKNEVQINYIRLATIGSWEGHEVYRIFFIR